MAGVAPRQGNSRLPDLGIDLDKGTLDRIADIDDDGHELAGGGIEAFTVVDSVLGDGLLVGIQLGPGQVLEEVPNGVLDVTSGVASIEVFLLVVDYVVDQVLIVILQTRGKERVVG